MNFKFSIIILILSVSHEASCGACKEGVLEKADSPTATEAQLIAAVKCFSEEDKNLDKGLEYLRRAAETEGVLGPRLYGNYLHGVNDSSFMEWWVKGMERGDAQCESNIGMAYLHGHGVDADLEKAHKHIKTAADHGDTTAQYNMGLLLLEGLPSIGIFKDEKNGALHLAKAAKAGHTSAMMELAVMTKRNGRYTKKSLKWLEPAHKAGNTEASHILGYMYKTGVQVDVDEEKAFSYYIKAARGGHAGSQYEVGLMYFYDTGVEEDYTLGRYWMEKAARQEHPNAMHNFGSILLKDDDPKKALLSQKQRAKQQKEDEQLALSMYASAASKGVLESVYILGYLHYKELYGLEKNHTLTSKYWSEAARGGHVKSLNALRKMAEDENHPEAIYQLGVLNEVGVEHIPQDEDLAKKLFREAADLGSEAARSKLGELGEEL
eukprot:TRINITY_DN1176_c2_g3_i1.p1 TRINITY_DN1176_c2_g3~~TRINITY_DN1176_c2_g3_i1.p1  ORF type:complete len:448 (+),score=92.50 TRINITY_DN1176_c2_g3_i1:39-1346(+)